MRSLLGWYPQSVSRPVVSRFGASLLFSLTLSVVPAWAQDATPYIDILSPAAVAPGRGLDVHLKISGTGFASNAHVTFNGDLLTPTSITNAEISVTVPAADVNAAGTANVTVVNPNMPPEVGASNVVFFPIVNATASVTTNQINWGAAGDGPSAVGDFNGDGNLDLAVADGTSITVLLGDGAGNFIHSLSSPSVSYYPQSIAVGDFNADGKLDLAVASECGTSSCTSGNVTVLLGDGAGNFTVASSPLAGFQPTSIATGDFNGDGKLDLVVSNYCNNDNGCPSPQAVTLLLGDGRSNFTAAPSPALTDMATSIAVGDFNEDGNLDLAITGFRGVHHITVLLGDGSGNFATTSPPALAYGGSMAVGDFNGDGNLDLAVGQGGNITVLLGDGRGNFTNTASPEVGRYVHSIVIGDFNGDGKLDFATLADNVSVLLQTSPYDAAMNVTVCQHSTNVSRRNQRDCSCCRRSE